MYVEGRVLSTDGKPVANAVIETWETDGDGETQRWSSTVIADITVDRFIRYAVHCS